MSPPHLQPRTFFGLRTDIQANAHYITENEVLYAIGGALVVHNHAQKRQRFIRLPDKHKSIHAFAISPNKRYLAISERGNPSDRGDTPPQKPTISIYDLVTMKRKKGLTLPFEHLTCSEFVAISFTWDSRYLIAITGEPDWWLCYYNWEKGKVESNAKGQNPSGFGSVNQVICNPTDNALICLAGPGTFRLMNVTETVWRQWGWCKAENLNITACTWLTPDTVFFGTNTGQFMTVTNGEMRQNCIYKAASVMEISLKKTMEGATESKTSLQQDKDANTEKLQVIGNEEVRCLLNFPKGFVYTCGSGIVHMFEKETSFSWKKRNVFKIMEEPFRLKEDTYVDLNPIQYISVSPNQETLMVTSLKYQLYFVKIFGMHMLQMPEIPFKEYGQPLHHGKINSVSMCSWKPIFITTGQDDRTIRVWNYETEELELIKSYQEEIHSVSLHPTGLFAVVGFSDKLRYMVVMIDDLLQMREFPIRNCKVCSFSRNGHMFAAANGTVIQVYSSVSFHNMFNLKGHNSIIKGLSWTANDGKLVSCGIEGAVYEWDTITAKRIGEVIIKTESFRGCAVTSYGKSLYTIGIEGEVKEVVNNAVIRNVKVANTKLDNMVLSRSDLIMFVSGGMGNLISVQLPLLDRAIFLEFHMHNKNITGLAMSYDDQTLVSVAEDASICVWKLTHVEGKCIALEKDFSYSSEILISKNDLRDKLNNIKLLATRMSELETEHAYQLRQTEASHSEKLQEVHEGYCAAIEELKEKNENMEAEHNHEMATTNQEIAKMKAKHESLLQSIEADFNEKLIVEYDKYQTLENKTSKMRMEYEDKLEELALSKRLALRELNDMFEAQLLEKSTIIDELKAASDQQEKEHEVIKVAVEDDADREIIEVRTSYEVQLKEEKDANVRLKGETGVMKKKLLTAQKDIDEFKHQVSQLRAEHAQFQKIIQALERDILDLKKDIGERDGTIQEKEKRIYDLKRKNQELEKYKFVLNFKIVELKNQLEPRERDIKQKKYRVIDLEVSLENLLRMKAFRELKIQQLQEKLLGIKKEHQREMERCTALKAMMRKIKVDMHNMSGFVQDTNKLKIAVKNIFHKYIEDVDFLRSRIAEDEAVREFNMQREHLERQITGLKKQLAKSTGGSKNDIGRIIDENCTLLGEINQLRIELKTIRVRCSEMESILGISMRYLPPAKAREKLLKAVEDRNILDEKFNSKIQQREEVISILKEENERLLGKVRCLGGDDKEAELSSGNESTNDQ